VTTGPFTLQVTDVRPDTENSVVLALAPVDGQDVPFRHGQHLTFCREFDGIEIRRCYSICALAPDGGLRVGIRRVDGGTFSTWATTELVAGDTIEAFAPSGSFSHELNAATGRSYVMVAAGSGITPIYSIAATVLAAEPEARVTLLQVDRSSTSAMLVDDVENLRSRHLGRLQLWRLYTREPNDLALDSGRPSADRIQAFIADGVLDALPDEVFICGPDELVQITTDVYLQQGVPRHHIHDELFTSAQVGLARMRSPLAATAEPVGTGSALLHGRETIFGIYEGDTILEAVERVRPDVPYSCRAGVCSTCRAHVDDGAVDMAVTHGLVPGEEEAGYVLTCQAEPTTATVRVDYDR